MSLSTENIWESDEAKVKIHGRSIINNQNIKGGKYLNKHRKN